MRLTAAYRKETEMGIDNVRAALQIVTGAGELTRTKALEAAGNLLALPGVGPTAARATQAAGQVSTLADELVAAAAANREMVRDLVRQEIESQVQRLGLATSTELAILRDEIDRLQVEVATLRAQPPAPADTPARTSAKAAPAKTAAKKAAPARSTAAKKTAPAKKTAAKKAPPAKKATTQKTTAARTRKTAAKKTTTSRRRSTDA